MMSCTNWLAGRLGLLSGAIGLALSFPSASLFPLAWVCLIPLLLRILQSHGLAPVVRGHLLFFISGFSLVLYWIPGVMIEYGGLPFIPAVGIFFLLAAAMSVLMLPFSILTWLIARASSEGAALVAAPALWTACELFRGHYVEGGFPWASLGYSQYSFGTLLQAADVGGVYFLSFLVVSGTSAVLLWTTVKRPGPALVYAALIGLSLLYGTYRLRLWEIETDHTHQAALVQPGIDLRGTRSYFQKVYFQQLPEAYARAAQAGADWVIFPEAPNPFSLDRGQPFREHWRTVVSGQGRPLVLNGIRSTPEAGVDYNSAFLSDEAGEFVYQYDKRHLVPFGEYLPRGSALLGLSRALVGEVGHFTRGQPMQEPAQTGHERFGLLICYESIFPELSRQAVQAGARFLVNITNDLWFGDTPAPRQHLQMAAVRAVELRKPLLRVANSGISAHIDSYGRVRERLGLFEVDTLNVKFSPNSYQSHFARFGQGTIGFTIILTLVGAFGEAILARRKGKHSGRLS